MCELLAMSSSVSEQLNLSLQILASHGDVQHGTNDGWGAAYYQGFDVALFREQQGAGSSELLAFLSQHGPETRLAISHIRRATMGTRQLANTQPFVRALAGRMHTFAHNGNLLELRSTHVLQSLNSSFQPIGETDSEHAFSYLLFLMQPIWQQTEAPNIQSRVEVFRQFCAEMRLLGPANFIYSDGEFLFVHAHKRIQRDRGVIAPPGLWMTERRCSHLSSKPESDEPAVDRVVTLVASVPLTQETWRPFEEAELLVLQNGQRILV
jgi:glutamine amidotransferase